MISESNVVRGCIGLSILVHAISLTHPFDKINSVHMENHSALSRASQYCTVCGSPIGACFGISGVSVIL